MRLISFGDFNCHILAHLPVMWWCVCRGGTGIHSLDDVLPMSSRYLVSLSSGSVGVGATQQKPDVAALAADNHALCDVVDQQRFKLKV